MGKPRVRGNHAIIKVRKLDGAEISIGEVSKFSVKELGEIKKSRAIGQNSVTANKTFEGYDLSFEGGKVDWNLAQLLHRQDETIYKGGRSPLFYVTQKIFFFDGSTEEFNYNDVVIYGYNLDIDANDELMEKFEGFCGTLRTPVYAGLAKGNEPGNVGIIDDLIKNAIEKKDTAFFSDVTRIGS
jgi:hypothetical protein